MNLFRLITLLTLSFAWMLCFGAVGQRSTDSLLNQLDSVIAHRDEYRARKESRLSKLHHELSSATTDRQRFDALGALYGEYHSFNANSAYAMSMRQERIARRLGDRNLIINAILNKANIMSNVGMYHETLSMIDTISSSTLPDYLKPYLFHTKRTVYGNLAAYSAFPAEREYYERITDRYRDSLLTVNDPNSIFYFLIKADQLNVHDQPQAAINLLESFVNNNGLSEHDMAICAWTLSEAYAKINDRDNQKRQVLISAISDMKSAVREYVSLRQLALMLYQEGDLERAYKFLTIAVDDAAKCNARQRIVELNASYPMINSIYVETVRNQKRALERTIWIIAILSVILIGLLLLMRKQMLRIAEGRRNVEAANAKLTESNDKLNDLNRQLVQSNLKLHEAYNAIAEISELKEVYICQYMDRSLEYIEMLDTYRKGVGKMVSSGKLTDLQTFVKSTKLIDDELKAFYAKFDETFLNIFPTFVEDFNNLLLPEEAIIPKKKGALNTELRVFALIRLGISDSAKIAKFLRYSLTTIYNYRTKVRNKAKGKRDDLESEVMKIGRN